MKLGDKIREARKNKQKATVDSLFNLLITMMELTVYNEFDGTSFCYSTKEKLKNKLIKKLKAEHFNVRDDKQSKTLYVFCKA